MTGDMGNAELIQIVESRLSAEAEKISRKALERNGFNVLWAFAGWREAYA